MQHLFNAESEEQKPGRALTADEVVLAQSVFGDGIDYSQVRVLQEKYVFFQPDNITMAPDGNIYFHPDSKAYSSNFGRAGLGLQGHFIHEMTHVWQHQNGINVVFNGIFQRNYNYSLTPRKSFTSYGIEQQGNIVRDYFFLQRDSGGGPAIERYRNTIPFAR